MKNIIVFSFAAILMLPILHGQQSDSRSNLRSGSAPFFHGVASGDPLTDRVIIWTRVTPDQINGDSILVHWRMAEDTAMREIVNQGTYYAKDLRDYTVKIDVNGLAPETCYYYDFRVDSNYSVRGRTITAPSGDNEQVRFAVVSCSNYEHGYFNVYRKIAERNDVQAVLHLGDYIYEYETGGYSANISGRTYEPVNEIITLDDYRLRYSHYRLDNDLQDIHQQYPFICIWDDHESANDAWTDGAENHTDGTEGDWQLRKSNSKIAYFEWLPIREKTDSSIYRKFEYGDLVNLFMLDTRIEGRDEQVGASSGAVNDPNRSLLGQTQFDWLKDELLNSNSRWNILGQQVMMAPLEAFGVPVNADQWDGYNAERNALYNHIMNNNIENIVVLTGDIHTSWANDLPLNNYNSSTGANSVGVEFVSTSVTSPGFPIGFGAGVIQSMNSHIKWADLTQKGYVILDIDKFRTQGEWYFVDNISSPGANESLGNAFFVNHQERHLNNASLTSLAAFNCTPAPALPYNPEQYASIEHKDVQLYGVYPNPFKDEFILHFGSDKKKEIRFELMDASGKVVYQQPTFQIGGPSEYFKVYTSDLNSGMYQLIIYEGQQTFVHRLVKY